MLAEHPDGAPGATVAARTAALTGDDVAVDALPMNATGKVVRCGPRARAIG
jgi:hypothetical protein